MKNRHDVGFADRLNSGAKARAEQLERARTRIKANSDTAAERQQARQKLVAEREARQAARAAAKAAEAARLSAERAAQEEAKAAEAERLKAQQAAEEEARLAAEKEAIEAGQRKKREESAKLAQILVDQKAARDARYAARKARSRRK